MVDSEAGRQMIFDSPDFTHSHQIYIFFSVLSLTAVTCKTNC